MIKFKGELAIFGFYLVPAILTTALAYGVARHFYSTKWYYWEMLGVFVPGLFYCLLASFHLVSGKSMGNFSEPIVIGFVYAIVFVVRSKLGADRPETNIMMAIAVPVVVSIVAVLVYFLTPSLPE